jgi:hypothetical protein
MTSRLPAVEGAGSAGAVGWRDGLKRAWMLGVHAWWSVCHDQFELGRRGQAVLPDLERLDVLDVVLRLPVGQAVAGSSLSRRQRATLAEVDPAVVGYTGGGYVRHARPCLDVERVVVPAQTFRAGLESASLFANYCVRSVVLPSTVAVGDLELAEASFYGIGVMRAVLGGTVEVAPPEPFEELPHTPASWAFNEVLARRVSSLS